MVSVVTGGAVSGTGRPWPTQETQDCIKGRPSGGCPLNVRAARADTGSGHPSRSNVRQVRLVENTTVLIEKMSTAQAAERFRVDERTIRRWVKSGRLHGYKHRGALTIEVVGKDPPDQADGQDVRDESDPMSAAPVSALVSARPIAELANIAHRLGQAERTAPAWARLALTITSAAAIAAGVVIALGHAHLVRAGARADVADTARQFTADRLADVRVDLADTRAQLDQARADRDRAVAEIREITSKRPVLAVATRPTTTASVAKPPRGFAVGPVRIRITW